MGDWVGSAPAWYGSSLGSNTDISQKYKMGDISKEVANTLQPAKNIFKKYLNLWECLAPWDKNHTSQRLKKYTSRNIGMCQVQGDARGNAQPSLCLLHARNKALDNRAGTGDIGVKVTRNLNSSHLHTAARQQAELQRSWGRSGPIHIPQTVQAICPPAQNSHHQHGLHYSRHGRRERDGWPLQHHTDVSNTRLHGGLYTTLF